VLLGRKCSVLFVLILFIGLNQNAVANTIPSLPTGNFSRKWKTTKKPDCIEEGASEAVGLIPYIALRNNCPKKIMITKIESKSEDSPTEIYIERRIPRQPFTKFRINFSKDYKKCSEFEKPLKDETGLLVFKCRSVPLNAKDLITILGVRGKFAVYGEDGFIVEGIVD